MLFIIRFIPCKKRGTPHIWIWIWMWIWNCRGWRGGGGHSLWTRIYEYVLPPPPTIIDRPAPLYMCGRAKQEKFVLQLNSLRYVLSGGLASWSVAWLCCAYDLINYFLIIIIMLLFYSSYYFHHSPNLILSFTTRYWVLWKDGMVSQVHLVQRYNTCRLISVHVFIQSCNVMQSKEALTNMIGFI